MAEAEKKRSISGCDASGIAAKRHRVLVLDDEEAVLESCTQVLAAEGLEVAGAPSGEEGLCFMGSRLPEVILVDLKMPGMSGMEFLKRAGQADPLMVAVVITGHATLSAAVEAMKIGAYDFLQKPFRADQLRMVTRRALEKRLLRVAAAEAEREKAHMRDLFVAMVSHQLKSPVASLKECLSAARRGYGAQMGKDCLELVQHAEGRATHLLNLLDDWLTLARMEAGSVAAVHEEVDLADAATTAVAEVLATMRQRKVDVKVDVSRQDAVVYGDSRALHDLIVNLVTNAVCYTPDGGCVSLTVEGQPGGVLVTVSDTGCGVPANEIDLIFESFYRAGNAASSEGTGLGLAIAKKIVESHGGHIHAESGQREGTALSAYIPRGQEQR